MEFWNLGGKVVNKVIPADKSLEIYVDAQRRTLYSPVEKQYEVEEVQTVISQQALIKSKQGHPTCSVAINIPF